MRIGKFRFVRVSGTSDYSIFIQLCIICNPDALILFYLRIVKIHHNGGFSGFILNSHSRCGNIPCQRIFNHCACFALCFDAVDCETFLIGQAFAHGIGYFKYNLSVINVSFVFRYKCCQMIFNDVADGCACRINKLSSFYDFLFNPRTGAFRCCVNIICIGYIFFSRSLGYLRHQNKHRIVNRKVSFSCRHCDIVESKVCTGNRKAILTRLHHLGILRIRKRRCCRDTFLCCRKNFASL